MSTKPDQAHRAITDANGATQAQYDLMPFGEEWQGSDPSGGPLFTGKPRDLETKFDYFNARYLLFTSGRFTTPDAPLFANPANPQSWNLYAYGLNRPLLFTDPSGHEADCDSGREGAPSCTDLTVNVTAPMPLPDVFLGVDLNQYLGTDLNHYLNAVDALSSEPLPLHRRRTPVIAAASGAGSWYLDPCVAGDLGRAAFAIGVDSLG